MTACLLAVDRSVAFAIVVPPAPAGLVVLRDWDALTLVRSLFGQQ